MPFKPPASPEVKTTKKKEHKPELWQLFPAQTESMFNIFMEVQVLSGEKK